MRGYTLAKVVRSTALIVVVVGVLAVTRSLGDSSMKDYVVGSPYTTETELCDVDEFLIIACDGVRLSSFPDFLLL